MSRAHIERTATTIAGLLFLLLLGTGAIDLGRLVERQELLAEAGAAAAEALSAGSDFEEAIRTIEESAPSIDLRGSGGRIVLTEVALDGEGRPVIKRRETRGALDGRSVTERYDAGGKTPPAPPGTSDRPAPGYTVLEIYSRYDRALATLAPGLLEKSIILSSVTVY